MPYKVEIDSGHGGKDGGAINSKTTEKVINLKVGVYLKAYLESKGIIVGMTRTKDVYVGLSTRAKMANDFQADLMISVHHNAGGGDGFEVIHSIHNGNGLKLAKEVATQFKALSQNAHGVEVFSRKSTKGATDYFTVIADSNMPCIITEYGFMDSTDFLAFDTDIELQKEAIAIGKAICIHFGISVAPTPSPIATVKAVVTPKKGIVTASVLNVRVNPVPTSKIIGELYKGDVVKIERAIGDMYSIYFGNHGGYVAKEYIK